MEVFGLARKRKGLPVPSRHPEKGPMNSDLPFALGMFGSRVSLEYNHSVPVVVGKCRTFRFLT